MTILDDIVAYKRREVDDAKAATPLQALEQKIAGLPPARGFEKVLRAKQAAGDYGLIAEVKKASPSKGLIRADFNPGEIAKCYERGGAACLSVLTDAPSFQGELTYLDEARTAATTLPALRKDFMLERYQVAEARAAGADCILIIMACTDDKAVDELIGAAKEYGLDWLIEVHDEGEVARALGFDSPMVGINNRNLATFETRLETSQSLAPKIPADRLIVAESGLSTPADLALMAEAGITTFLIGESLMRQDDVETATKALLRR